MTIDIYSDSREDTIDVEEFALWMAIMDYRATLGLPSIPLSQSLTLVASRHVLDTVYNIGEYISSDSAAHGWSDAPYRGSDPSTYPSMWEAPARLGTDYRGYGYEISVGYLGDPTLYEMTAEIALNSWQGSPGHNDVIVNAGPWTTPWQAIGVAIHEGVSHVWFGHDIDPAGAPRFEPEVGSDAIASPTDPVVDDFLLGTDSRDELNGGAGNDTLVGEASDDRLRGGSGNDEMDGGSGNDIIVGGPGFDTATFSGPQSANTLTISTSGISIRDRRAEGNGIDEISGIEMLDFLDNDWPLHLFDGGASLSEREVRELVEVYIAYFNRAPDAIGLAFYADSLTRGSTIEEAARTFLNSDEYSAAYPPELSNADFAREVYLNVLGREPDPNGFEFWVGHLDSGAIGRELFVLDVLRGVKPGTGDEEYLATKTDLGIYLAITKGLSVGGRTVMNSYDGSVESVEAAVEIIDDLYEAGADPFSGDFIIELVGVADDPFSA